MEVNFEEEFHTNDTRLSPELRKQFYEKLKQVVVYIVIEPALEDVTENEMGKQMFRSPDGQLEELRAFEGSGVIMDNRGFILTCAHIFRPDFKIIFVRHVDEDFHFRAELVAKNIDLDLAILKPINNDGVRYNFSKFGSLIDVGMEVFSIAHPGPLCYTLAIGHVAFPCTHSITDGLVSPMLKTPGGRVYGDIIGSRLNSISHRDKNLQVIQISNFHLVGGSSGGPMFDPQGRDIGISSYGTGYFHFVVHLSMLKKFWEDFVPKPRPPKKRKRSSKVKRKRWNMIFPRSVRLILKGKKG
ncbi:uncharacterized protein LOC131314318 [Rhododendron vialii]|uniref:uncharacterized protein LOC131314318 n=1 Tax=Rhododendron vialii TaxID=182163 RepID=UPI0026601BE5|nr:uncharacterized protein LOC131314318 [Rhododendron vialii]